MKQESLKDIHVFTLEFSPGKQFTDLIHSKKILVAVVDNSSHCKARKLAHILPQPFHSYKWSMSISSVASLEI